MKQLPPVHADMNERELSRWLQDLAGLAVEAVHPDNLMSGNLPAPGRKTVVVGAGKASAAMAAALETAWHRQYPEAEISGLVVTRYGHAAHCVNIEVLEASHPMPDKLGEVAATRMLEAVADLGEEDLVIALISGGGSALMSLPAPGLTLQQKQTINRALLRCGAPIREINTVRRHLSAVKGGRLAAAAHPARVATYLISDVPGDDPTLIASGPTLPDASTPADALAILEHYGIEIAPEVRAHLESATDSPSPDDFAFSADTVSVLAKAADALESARDAALATGLDVRVLGDNLEGEARELGAEHAALALTCKSASRRPLLLLSGGETSVTVTGNGRGGRNVEYLLGLFSALGGAPGIHGLAIDTDGIDGSEDNAGAFFAPGDWARMQAQGLDPQSFLAGNDAYSFFAELGNLIVTGPTRTNVNDFRAILVFPDADT